MPKRLTQEEIDERNKKLKYIKIIKKQKDGKYLCQCKCGNYCTRSNISHLTNNSTCGDSECEYYRKLQSSCRRFYNKYDLSNDYGIGYTNKGEKFYFDIEDYDKIKKYTWYKDARGYIRTNMYNYETKQRDYQFLHCLIMGIKPNTDTFVDHIGGIDTINDNRKCNLRIVNLSESCINQSLRKDNTSGYKGINRRKSNGKWTVRIQTNYKRIYIGDYDTLEEAIIAREKAESKYHSGYNYNDSQKIYNDHRIAN